MKLIEIEGFKTMTILNEQQTPTKCKGKDCNASIYWVNSPINPHKRLPIVKNKEGKWIDHFTNCPNANQF